jgi:copper chaperone CopZ
MVQTDWKIEGMTCSNCALTISKIPGEGRVAGYKSESTCRGIKL